MKLIADSGSTKTDWTLLHDTGRRADEVFVKTFKTQGITPSTSLLRRFDRYWCRS